MYRKWVWVGVVFTLVFLGVTSTGSAQSKNGADQQFIRDLHKIDYVIVIYQENWSFDGLYGKFPGANGLKNAKSASPQLTLNGDPVSALPIVLNDKGRADKRFPPENGEGTIPAVPFDLTKYIKAEDLTGDLVHRFYHEQLQIDGGKMDKFVAWSDNGGLVMSYFDASNMPEGLLAQEFTLCDNVFHSAFGGSFLNHQFLIAAAPPTWPNAPASAISNRENLKDNVVTPDGFAVNTVFSVNAPHPQGIPVNKLLPQQTNPTIGDRLTDKSISWRWYSGGWDNVIAEHPDEEFQYHHQPFVYYAKYKDGTPARKEHLQDEERFFKDLEGNHLPQVSFIKPLGTDNEHPGYATLLKGQEHVKKIVDAIRSSPIWSKAVIIITYDENGGRWDHVAPPVRDRWGPGTRVPTIVISPFAKKGKIDPTQYETLSILKLLEVRFGLDPLTRRDAAANPFRNVFDFGSGTQ